MMQSASLPLPEVIELLDVPTEFAALARCDRRSWPSDIRSRPAASAGPLRARLGQVQVQYLDNPRASVLALFA